MNSEMNNSPLELTANTEYPIIKFLVFKNNKSGKITTSDNKDYWINQTCCKIFNDYFKMKNGKITCIYDNRLVYPKLTLITEDEVKFETSLGSNRTKIIQKLKLEIEESNNNSQKQVKSFTFHINYSDNIDLEKEGLYKFSTILVVYNRIILGYEYNEDKYYNLYQFRDYILNNIDKDTASLIKKELKSNQKQSNQSDFIELKADLPDIYTYLYKSKSNSKSNSMNVMNNSMNKVNNSMNKVNNSNKPLGLGIKIDNDRNFQIVNGNLDKTFKRILDISKLSKNNKIIIKDEVTIDFD